MPILFVVKPTRRRLYEELRRLVARPGLVGVVLERRRGERRAGDSPIAFVDRRGFTLRQPLDGDSARTWEELGFLVVKVHALAEARPPSAMASLRVLRPRRPSRAGAEGGPASRRPRKKPR